MTRTCSRSSFMMISGQWALRNKTSWSLFKFPQAAAAHVTRRRSRVTRRSKNKIKAAQLTPRKVIVVMHSQVHTQFWSPGRCTSSFFFDQAVHLCHLYKWGFSFFYWNQFRRCWMEHTSQSILSSEVIKYAGETGRQEAAWCKRIRAEMS